jgi:hypothetical protein
MIQTPKPSVVPPPKIWQDIYANPPPDKQEYWLRRQTPGFPLVKTVWNLADTTFTIGGTLHMPT